MRREALTATLWIFALAPLGAAQSECVAFVDLDSHPTDAHQLEHADLNGDGFQDLLLGTPGPAGRTVQVLLGNGDGSFAALPPYVMPNIGSTDQIFGLGTGDLDGDAVPDLVICVDNITNGYFYVALGVGDGSFGPGSTFVTRQTPTDVLIRDLNADGAPDLLAVNFKADGVSVLLGVGDGSFGPATLYPTRNGPHTLAEIDLNGDAALDLIVAHSFSEKFALLVGVGDGSFLDGGVLPHDFQLTLAVGDTNGDGIDDLVTTKFVLGELKLAVFLGEGGGQFAPVLLSQPTPWMHARNSELLDIDGDGQLDIAVVRDSEVYIFLGVGDGSFAPAMILEGGERQRGIDAGDWNGDGMPDLALLDWLPGKLRILLQSAVGAEAYCSTSPNSAGPGALITAAGSFHVEDDDLNLTVTGLPANQPGLFFCGDLVDAVPFEGGTLCVGSTHGLYRLPPPVSSSAAGTVTRAVSLEQRPFDEEWSTVLPGSSWSFQYWYRDAAAPVSSRINLSDAVRVQFCL